MNLVLNISLGKVSDGAGAEAEQDIAGIGGVTLEVPVKPSILQCYRHLVVGKREMVQSDCKYPASCNALAIASD